MGNKFVFVEDVNALLRQGKTEVVLPDGTRFSPAARDLIREEGIQVIFTDVSSEIKSDDPEEVPRKEDTPKKNKPAARGLIAVASRGRDITGPVGKDATKEPFFLIFDIEGRFIDVIKNPYANQNEAAEPFIANLMTSSQVTSILAENIGSSLQDQLEAKKVQYLEISGPIRDAVQKLTDNMQ